MSAYQTKYHVYVNGKRTMVTVDTFLSRMYAAELGIDDLENGKQSTELREAIQKLVDERPIDGHVSQHVRMSMLFKVAKPKLISAAIKQGELNFTDSPS